MAIAANATDAFSGGSGGSEATSATATIPSGAGIGDTLFLVFTASNGSSSATAPTMSVSSTGTAWTQIGATEACAISSFIYLWSSIWYVKVASADRGATVTLGSTTSLYLAGAAAGYSGIAGTPVDAVAFDIGTSGQETIPTNTVSAGAGTDWLLYLGSIASDASMGSVTKPSAATSRSTYFAYNEVWAGVSDSNAAVGPGTVGGGSFTSGFYSGYVTWTVAVSLATITTITGAAALSGSGSLAPAKGSFGGAAALSGSGTLGSGSYTAAYAATYTGGVPYQVWQHPFTLSGSGTLTGSGNAGIGALLTGSGAMAATRSVTWRTTALLSGTGAMSAAYFQSALSGSGSLSVSGVRLFYPLALSGIGTLSVLQVLGGLVQASAGAAAPYAYPGTSQVAVAPPGTAEWSYLGSIGTVTALTYSFTCPGGADSMTCTVMVPAAYRTQLFDPGWQVRITRGGHQVWDGKLDEPVPTASGWNLTAVGTGNRGTDFLAIYGGTWPSGQPDAAVNAAITRGLPWANPGVGTPSGAWFGQAVDSGAQTITALLNLICTRGGLTWMVNSQPGGTPGDDLNVFPLPSVVNRLLVCTTPVARTLGGDINTIWIKYSSAVASGTTPAAFGVTSVQNTASVAAHGVLETYIDLSNAGVMSASAAQAVGQQVLAIYTRASFAGPFSGSYGSLLTTGGQPIDPGTDQAGTFMRLILTDFGMGGEVTPQFPVTFITGAYSWDDFSQQFTATPYVAVDASLTGLLSLESILLTPITAAA